MSCSTPSSISNGYFIGTSFNNGDSVSYFCDENYSISGSRTVTCTSGTWTGGYPSCSFSFLSNAYFIIISVLLGILVILLIAVLCILCRKHCCKRKRENYHDGKDNESDIYMGADEERNVKTTDTKVIQIKDKPLTVFTEPPCDNQTNNTAPASHEKPSWDSGTKPTSKALSKTKGWNVRKKTINIHKKNGAINPNKKGETYIIPDSDKGSNASVRKVAVSLDAWKPFSNPVRNINTSTQ